MAPRVGRSADALALEILVLSTSELSKSTQGPSDIGCQKWLRH
jgi:hypothetical protein